ncbi:hypothetical protein Gotri_006796 [Gossypium trilobum]|uniref:Uncharacterized protein n=1 Tax=Gossypium trilobum TaxID=34281 RepID=A0A7J9FS20_9ROSI|nr:hypothetical protein [Gossypium trilobum]
MESTSNWRAFSTAVRNTRLVELWVELRGTTREARRYYIIVRSTLRSRDVIRRHRRHILHSAKGPGQLTDVGCQVRVEVMNFVATMKLERAAHGGHAGEGQQRWKIRAKRQHQLPQQHRKGRGHPSGSLSTPAEDAPSVAMQYPVIDAKPHVGTDANICTATNDDTDAVVDNNVDG